MNLTQDPVNDFSHVSPEDAAEERDLFGNVIPPAAKRQRAPGPAPNPASGRQRKLAAAAMRNKTVKPPPKRATKNTTAAAKAETITETRERGAYVVIGWVAKPLAGAALAMQAASMMPKVRPERRAVMERNAYALTLDSLTVGKYSDTLAQGAAQAADALPWMARVLEQAAKIGPYAALGEAALGLVFQVLVNHGIMPARPELGTVTPDELIMETMGAQAAAPVG